jgi:hypothetical protein
MFVYAFVKGLNTDTTLFGHTLAGYQVRTIFHFLNDGLTEEFLKLILQLHHTIISLNNERKLVDFFSFLVFFFSSPFSI